MVKPKYELEQALLFNSVHKLCHLNSKRCFMVVIRNIDNAGFFVHSNEHSALTTYIKTIWSKFEYPLYHVHTFVTSARVDASVVVHEAYFALCRRDSCSAVTSRPFIRCMHQECVHSFPFVCITCMWKHKINDIIQTYRMIIKTFGSILVMLSMPKINQQELPAAHYSGAISIANGILKFQQ